MWKLDHIEDWAPKNWCLQTVVLEKTLESPLDSREIQPVHPKGNQSWIFIGIFIQLKLKLQYFGHLLRRTDSLEKTPILGKIEDWRRRGRQRMRWLGSTTNSMDMNLSRPWEIVKDEEALKSQGVEIWLKDSKFCCYCSAAQSCPTLSVSMDYSSPGSSIHGISQTRILEWVAISFSIRMCWMRRKGWMPGILYPS